MIELCRQLPLSESAPASPTCPISCSPALPPAPASPAEIKTNSGTRGREVRVRTREKGNGVSAVDLNGLDFLCLSVGRSSAAVHRAALPGLKTS